MISHHERLPNFPPFLPTNGLNESDATAAIRAQVYVFFSITTVCSSSVSERLLVLTSDQR